MRRRALVIATALFVAYLAAFSSSDATLTSRTATSAAQPSTTTPSGVEVDVEPKVVEQGPLKDPVDIDGLAQTGSDGAADLAIVGLSLVAIGLVLVDLVSVSRGRSTPRAARR